MAIKEDAYIQIYTEKKDAHLNIFSGYDVDQISIFDLLDTYKSISPVWQIGYGGMETENFVELFKNERRESVRMRRPIWMDDDTIHINLNETEPDQFHLIEYEEGNYLVGVTKDNKLQMYLLPKESKD